MDNNQDKLLYNRWFQGFMSNAEADIALQRQRVNTFLVRFRYRFYYPSNPSDVRPTFPYSSSFSFSFSFSSNSSIAPHVALSVHTRPGTIDHFFIQSERGGIYRTSIHGWVFRFHPNNAIQDLSLPNLLISSLLFFYSF